MRQYHALGAYWRQPQPFVNSPLEISSFISSDMSARHFKGAGGFCEGEGEDFREDCKHSSCTPALIERFDCGPAFG